MIGSLEEFKVEVMMNNSYEEKLMKWCEDAEHRGNLLIVS
jgi:hypothetical protein